ncbi:hypothetical protein Fmac_014600 [Flemingia macrophylla]|uniref:Protein kinase domain-containing protein n=1 Tax=Flemingia macrophylla TaxID=520843 RepID=A0ABD1MC62_9FABA
MSNLATSPLHTFASTLDNVAPCFFTLFELQTATHNFLLCSNIGGGDFGVAYKDKLADGRVVAIKRVRSFLNIKDPFKSELAF